MGRKVILALLGCAITAGVWHATRGHTTPAIDQEWADGAATLDPELGEVADSPAESSRSTAPLAPDPAVEPPQVVTEPTSELETPSERPEAPDSIEDELRYANQIAVKRGWNRLFPLDGGADKTSRDGVRDALKQFEQTTKDIEAVRMPLLDRIAEAKVQAGQVEYEPGYEARRAMSPRERKELSRQRRPSQPDQTVVMRGSAGGQTMLIRINANEDPSLQFAYERYHDAEELFLQRVALLVNPIPRDEWYAQHR